MRRIRIAIVGSSPCQCCTAACCKQNGHAFAALLEGEEVRRFAPWSIDAKIQTDTHIVVEKVLPYLNGRCVFLGDDDRCSVYDSRPRACRAFECALHFNRHGIDRHGEFLNRNPRVLKLLGEI